MTFKAYDKREEAKKQNFHATPELLSRLVVEKLREYNLPHRTILDNSVGSGQLERFVDFEILYAYEIDENARAVAKENFGDKIVFLGDNALIVEDYPVCPDCVIANPPFAIKKEWSSDEDKANVLAYLNKREDRQISLF
ncbi:hypothetical protein [Streptococcus cuniculipharyngis]|uniref:Uncharacterized protein n=1 Tax=Streptococcus cuniculipharyngis TaxID=1562651 RepID=A0A5C5SGC4_9STRE|nr:hypothetical protein [Streptococcus cuniculipharyngis]TWS99168.1 hypothetical protein FRX57_02940 [Streptococcus cuniculipharyngis]